MFLYCILFLPYSVEVQSLKCSHSKPSVYNNKVKYFSQSTTAGKSLITSHDTFIVNRACILQFSIVGFLFCFSVDIVLIYSFHILTIFSPNKQPKYQCICESGWESSAGNPSCVTDVNECNLPNKPCSTNPSVPCYNTQGSFYCGTCPAGNVQQHNSD